MWSPSNGLIVARDRPDVNALIFLQRHRNVLICDNGGQPASAVLAFSERLLLAEAVEKLFWGLPNERLIRDTALKRKKDSLRSRI